MGDPSGFFGGGGGGLGDLASGASGFSGIGNAAGGGVPDFGGGGGGLPFGGDPQLTGDTGFPGGGGFPGDTGGFPGGFPGGSSGGFASTPAGNVGTQNDPALVAPATMNQGSQSGPAAGATAPGAGTQPSQGRGLGPAQQLQQPGGTSHITKELQQIADMLLGKHQGQEAGTGMPPSRQFAQAATGTMSDAGTVMMPPGADQSAPNVQTEPFGGEWSGAPTPQPPEQPLPPLDAPDSGRRPYVAKPGETDTQQAVPLPRERPPEAPQEDFPPLPQERPAEAPAAIEPKPPTETTTDPGAAPSSAGPTGGGQQPQFNPFRAIADFITNPMGSLMGLLRQLGGQGGFYPGIPNAPASWGTPPTGPQDPRWGKGPGTPGGVGPETAPVSPQSDSGPGGKNDPNEAGISPAEKQRRIRARDLGQPGTYVRDKNGKMVRTQTNPDGSPKFDAEGNPVPVPAETGGAGGDPGGFIGQRGGHSTLNGVNQSNNTGLNPQLAQRLSAAGQAYERETGQRAQYGEGYRDRATQARYWAQRGNRYDPNNPAAPPGKSLHNRGLAMDMPDGAGFTRWLQRGNAQRFGLGFPVHNDSNHIQMQDIRGRAYPYTPPAEASFGTQGGGGPQQQMGFASPQEANQFRQTVAQIESNNNPRNRTGNQYGLYQYSPDQFRHLGITDWRDRGQMDRALTIETNENRQALRNALGREPTGGELYLMHQQGAGALNHLRNPNGSAVQNMLSTGEGRQKGLGWAQRAIKGNIPRDNPLSRVPVNQITSKQFTNMWSQRFNRAGGQPAAPYRDVGSSTRAEATRNTQMAANEQFANPPGRTVPPNMPSSPDYSPIDDANPRGEEGLVYPPGWPIMDRTGAGRHVVVSSAAPNTQLAMRGDTMSDAPLPGNAVAPFEQRFEGDQSDPNVPEYDPANTSMPMGRRFLPDPVQRQFSGQKVRVASTTALPEIKVTPPPKEGKAAKEPGKRPSTRPKGMKPGMKKRIQARRQQPPPYEPQLHRSGAGPYYWE